MQIPQDDWQASQGWFSSLMPLHTPKAKPNNPTGIYSEALLFLFSLVVMSLLVPGCLGAFSAHPHSAGTFLVIF